MIVKKKYEKHELNLIENLRNFEKEILLK